MVFGQVVVGPPGSGKTTYCDGMHQFLNSIGRKVAIINLDPANDVLPYEAAADISDLIALSKVAQCAHLGPNGSLLFCMEYLAENIDWLESKLDQLKDSYVLIDLPGQVIGCNACMFYIPEPPDRDPWFCLLQVELYSHHTSIKDILHALERKSHRSASEYPL